MRDTIALTAAVISFSGILPYVRDIIKGKTHPNMVSWISWCMLNLLNTSAAISIGAYQTAMLSGASATACGLITFLSIRRGVKKYTAFDIVCQTLVVVGLIAWKLTGQPQIAVLLSVSTDLVAALPTWRHAWIKPFEETWQGFALADFAAIVTLFTIEHYSFVSLAFPILVLTNCSVMTSVIIIRRAKVSSRPVRHIAADIHGKIHLDLGDGPPALH